MVNETTYLHKAIMLSGQWKRWPYNLPGERGRCESPCDEVVSKNVKLNTGIIATVTGLVSLSAMLQLATM